MRGLKATESRTQKSSYFLNISSARGPSSNYQTSCVASKLTLDQSKTNSTSVSLQINKFLSTPTSRSLLSHSSTLSIALLLPSFSLPFLACFLYLTPTLCPSSFLFSKFSIFLSPSPSSFKSKQSDSSHLSERVRSKGKTI